MSSPYTPWGQLLFCPVWGLNLIGRMISMVTSKIPVWPDEVEQECPTLEDDPYSLTAEDNLPLGWWKLWYPCICAVIGVGIFASAIAWLILS